MVYYYRKKKKLELTNLMKNKINNFIIFITYLYLI